MPWGAAAAVVVGYLGYKASQDSGEKAAQGARYAAEIQKQMYDQGRSDLDPYRQAGGEALAKLMYHSGIGLDRKTIDTALGIKSVDALKLELRLSGKYTTEQDHGLSTVDQDAIDRDAQDIYDKNIASSKKIYDISREGPGFGSLNEKFQSKTFGIDDFQADPGYGFRKAEGEKALTRGLAARGLSESTPGLKALMSFNQDLASDEYSAAYGRFEQNEAKRYNRFEQDKSQQFNLLSYISGTGQNAAAMTGQMGVNTAFGMGGAAMAGANAQAAATTGRYAAIAGGINSGVGNYMYQQRYNQQMDYYKSLFSQTNTTGGGGAGAGNANGDYPG